MEETKAALKERLIQEGKWEQFLYRRGQWRQAGHTAKDAHRLAAKEFSVASDCAVASTGDFSSSPVSRAGFDAFLSDPAPPPPAEDNNGAMICLDTFTGHGDANFRDVVQWVFDHVAFDIDELKQQGVLDQAPSSGAVGLLQWAQKSGTTQTEFYRTIWAKLIPARSKLDEQEGLRDDGRNVLHIIHQLLGNVDANGDDDDI